MAAPLGSGTGGATGTPPTAATTAMTAALVMTSGCKAAAEHDANFPKARLSAEFGVLRSATTDEVFSPHSDRATEK